MVKHAEIKVGNCLPLENIPVGTQIHNIELYPGKGGQLVRSAGNSAQLWLKKANMQHLDFHRRNENGSNYL